MSFSAVFKLRHQAEVLLTHVNAQGSTRDKAESKL